MSKRHPDFGDQQDVEFRESNAVRRLSRGTDKTFNEVGVKLLLETRPGIREALEQMPTPKSETSDMS